MTNKEDSMLYAKMRSKNKVKNPPSQQTGHAQPEVNGLMYAAVNKNKLKNPEPENVHPDSDSLAALSPDVKIYQVSEHKEPELMYTSIKISKAKSNNGISVDSGTTGDREDFPNHEESPVTYADIKTDESLKSAASRQSSTIQVIIRRWSIWLVPGLSIICLILLVILLSVHMNCKEGYSNSTSGSGAWSHSSDEAPPCLHPWIVVGKKCYYFSEEKKTQIESNKNCTNSGSTLAKVTKREEILQRLIRITGQKFWLGLNNTKANIQGKWEGKWSDGSKVILNRTDEQGNCAIMGYILQLENCYTEHRWICERDTAG